MEMQKAVKRSITLRDSDHTYWDEDKNLYISATQLISKITPKFDTEYHAKKYAERHGQTKEYWIKEWKRIRDEACEKGNRVHDKLEDGVNDFYDDGAKKIEGTPYTMGELKRTIRNTILNAKSLKESPLKYIYPKIYNRLCELIDDGYTLIPEKKVYWFYYLVAGKIDLPAFKDKRFKIIDWKTNKDELKFENGYYKKEGNAKTNIWIKKDERMEKPLNHLAHCKGIIYSLQLSLYAYLVELWGYHLEDLELWHIIGNQEKMYMMPYLEMDVRKLLEWNMIGKKKKELKFGINI